MSKRGENIYKRKDGRWEGRFIKSYGNNGKVLYAYVYGRTYAEAKERLLSARIALAQGRTEVRDSTLFKEIVSSWLTATKLRVKESTFSRYSNLVKNHITPYLGEALVNQINTQMVQQHLAFLLKSGRSDGKGGLSTKTVSDVLTVLKGIIDYGTIIGFSLNCNVDKLTIKQNSTVTCVLIKEDQDKLLNVLLTNTDVKKFGVLVCMYTGIRIGEICALKWSNIDVELGILSIRETLQSIQNVESGKTSKTKIIISEPKSKSSMRDIHMPSFLIDISKKFQTASGSYVLTGEIDKHIEPRVLQYSFRNYLVEADISFVNYHALRHTFCNQVY